MLVLGLLKLKSGELRKTKRYDYEIREKSDDSGLPWTDAGLCR
jgi:hypothetical protein